MDVYHVMLPDETLDLLFNDKTIMELIPDEETSIETEDLEATYPDSQGLLG